MRIRNLDSSKVYFTSDTHFHHSNIIKFCDRPWGSSKTMDSALIQNWNEIVPPDGVVFHLGDFAFTSNVEYIADLVSKLNGTIHLIFGNHDYQYRYDRESILELFGHRAYDSVIATILDEEIDGGKTRIYMSHFPAMYWFTDAIHLHGHIHSGSVTLPTERPVALNPKRYDVGVDNNSYKPISYNKLKIILTKRHLKTL